LFVSITILPARGSTGTVRWFFSEIVTMTMSPAFAASTTVAARAFGPSSATSAVNVSGPRELLMTTS
jgi:hypothetical protein